MKRLALSGRIVNINAHHLAMAYELTNGCQKSCGAAACRPAFDDQVRPELQNQLLINEEVERTLLGFHSHPAGVTKKRVVKSVEGINYGLLLRTQPGNVGHGQSKVPSEYQRACCGVIAKALPSRAWPAAKRHCRDCRAENPKCANANGRNQD